MQQADSQCSPCDARIGIPGFGFRIGISLALAGQGMVFGLGYNNALEGGEAPPYGGLAYALLHAALIVSAVAVVALLGGPLLRETREAIAQRRLSVEALFVLSAFGAFGGSLISTVRGTGSVYYEVVSIVLCVYAIGKQIGVVHKGRVGEAVASFRSSFDTAQIRAASGEVSRVPVRKVQPSDRVLVFPGDPIPVDGIILNGSGYIRETALTGEPSPVRRTPGERALAGTWSIDGNLEIQPELDQPRTIDQILRLLDNATAAPSRLQESADRLMQVFVPVVSLVACGTFAGWLLFSDQSVWDALFNAMAVLLVACPCALGLAMPAGIWAGLYYLGQRGVVGRHGHLLDSLADCTVVVFDKTGTLSQFDLAADTRHLGLVGLQKQTLLEEIASLGRASKHPVSQALGRLAKGPFAAEQLVVFPGEGLGGRIGDVDLLLGETSLLKRAGIACPGHLPSTGGKPVAVARNGEFAGYVLLREVLREASGNAIEAILAMGCRCRILSGDPSTTYPQIGGVRVEGSLTPEGKAEQIRGLVDSGEQVLFVGDGINDLPAMEASQASLAIDLGAALATEFADGVLLDGQVSALPAAIRHARRLKKHLRGNLTFALGYNFIGMALAAAGLLHPVVAALLMVGSSTIVSARALHAASQAA